MNQSNKILHQKVSVELDDVDVDFDDNSWVMQDITITVEAEGDKPEQRYEGKLLISRIPINEN